MSTVEMAGVGPRKRDVAELLVEATTVCAAAFWRDLAERAAKTFCQTLVVVLGAGRVGLMSASWVLSLSLGAAAAALSLLTSVGSRLAPIGTPMSPSLVDTFPETYARARSVGFPAGPGADGAARPASSSLRSGSESTRPEPGAAGVRGLRRR